MQFVRRHPRVLILLVCTSLFACDGGGGGDADKVDATPEGYCDDEIPCSEEATPFCDTTGVYPESNSVPNTCITQPPMADCSDTVPCEDEALPACNSIGQCVECVNFSQCNTTNPACALSTYSCGPCRLGEQGDALCEAIDILLPLCGESGSCVECLDNTPCQIVTAPICDPAEFSCRGCENTEECDTGTCNTVTGVCEVAE